jgi:hypothetical protein
MSDDKTIALVEIAKRNGDFRRNYGVVLGGSDRGEPRRSQGDFATAPDPHAIACEGR